MQFRSKCDMGDNMGNPAIFSPMLLLKGMSHLTCVLVLFHKMVYTQPEAMEQVHACLGGGGHNKVVQSVGQSNDIKTTNMDAI